MKLSGCGVVPDQAPGNNMNQTRRQASAVKKTESVGQFQDLVRNCVWHMEAMETRLIQKMSIPLVEQKII